MLQQLCNTKESGASNRGTLASPSLSSPFFTPSVSTFQRRLSDCSQISWEQCYHLRKSTHLPFPYQLLTPSSDNNLCAISACKTSINTETTTTTTAAVIVVWSWCNCTKANGGTVKVCVYKSCGHARCMDGCVPTPMSTASKSSLAQGTHGFGVPISPGNHQDLSEPCFVSGGHLSELFQTCQVLWPCKRELCWLLNLRS